MNPFKGTALAVWTSLMCIAAGAGADPVFVVNRPQVNIRADATIQAPRIAVLQQGEELEQLRRKDEWFQVRLPDGRNGWINANLVLPRLVVGPQSVALRQTAAGDGAELTVLAAGETLTRLDQRGDWLQVQAGDGSVGWVQTQRVRPKMRADRQAAVEALPAEPAPARPQTEATPVVEAPARPQIEVPPAVEAPAPDTQVPLLPPPTAVERDPYAQGLQHKRDGQHEAALASFAQVLARDPDHLNALYHIAEVHKQMGQHEEALERLYHALAISGPRPDARFYLVLGDVYRLLARPDSARKYQALFRGEEWDSPKIELPMPQPQAKQNSAADPFKLWWLLVAAAAGAVLLAGVAFFWWRRSDRAAGFSTQMDRSADSVVEEPGPGGEEELDRQIDEKWEALRQSAGAFSSGTAGEEAQMDELLGQMEALRTGLGQQDERARLYAEIVRLQNMKIEALKDEITLLRRQRRSG